MSLSEAKKETVERTVRDVIGVVLPSVPADAVTGDKHLRDLGADSVDRVEIILMLMERLHIVQPMSTFSTVPDINGLVALLVERCAE